MDKKTYRAGQSLPEQPPANQAAAPPPVPLPAQQQQPAPRPVPRPQGAVPPPTPQPPRQDADLRLPKQQPKPRRKKWPVVLTLLLALVLGLGAGGGLALWLNASSSSGAVSSGPPSSVLDSTTSVASLPQSSSVVGGDASSTDALLAGVTPRNYSAIALPDEMRAMWFAYLEWMNMDFSSEAAFRTQLEAQFTNCADMGLNTVLVMVHPFSDAMYQSSLFPWSHVMSGSPRGEQGHDPGFDPLAVMVEVGHAKGLRVEAWMNPYRVQLPSMGPPSLSDDNPASQNPEWASTVNNELWYDPGLPEVEDLVVKSVLEIVQNYDVDGIHFDDYFYPSGAEDSFDAATYAQYGAGATLTDWRLENISRMVARVKQAVDAANPTASFGISVQGNNSANYNQMYADVNRWLAEDGFADYIMPQIYWGFGHVDSAGTTNAAFDKRAAEWAAHSRSENVRLYCGLATYRIGMLESDGTRSEFGGNGYGDNSEWESGHAMADQVEYLRSVEGFSGFALFRYDFMFQSNDDLSAAEVAALSTLLNS